MNIQLNPDRLIELLAEAPDCTPEEFVSFHGDVNHYLFEHYLMPYLQDTPPTLANFNFSQFTYEDVEEFGQYLQRVSETSVLLSKFCGVFAAHQPLAATKRSFC